MQSWLLLLVVLILSKPQEVMGLGHSCLKWRLDSDGQTRATFLREEGATGARALYLSVWSASMRPVGCEFNSDPGVTERYRALCDGTESAQNAPGFNISALWAPDGPCARLTPGAPKFSGRARRDGSERGARRKRAWILPGTLWCGRGSEAVRYEQLGMFENTDRCCREHDHCLHIIPPFRVNYGAFNPNLYVVSHCDCDQRFRECLLSVNDTISSMVGYSFFNILRVPCFELKQKRRCTEMYWWGICKVAKEAPYAVFKPSRPYNASDTESTVTSGEKTDVDRSPHATEQPATSLHKRSPKGQHRCGSRGRPRGDTFHQRRTKGEPCKRQPPVAPSQTPTIRSKIPTLSMNTGHLNVSKSRELTTNKKKVGKMRGIDNSATKSQVPPQATLSYQQRSNPSSTHQLHLQATATVARATEAHEKVSKRRRCCKSRKPVRDDASQQRCKSCSAEETASDKTAATPATATDASHANVTTLRAPPHDTAKETPAQATLWDSTTFTRNGKAAAFLRVNARSQKQVDFKLSQDNISQEPLGSSGAQSSYTERSLKGNESLRNMTDDHLICGSLKHLDECKYKIPPMEKRYDLQNAESKAAYHCDCTSRLAVVFEGFNHLSVLPILLKDYVSQYCFNLPKDKKCLARESCSGGFAVASDLLQTLKETEVTDATWRRYSDINKRRGFPVRLYKRCLRLEREAFYLKIQ
ncbi:group 3 secretory phospholipase A2-like [Betta splendens]|uniref:phospholipase A2 n=1 Tax=Betta splendens TaxID=158456 RepID=A0A6P7NHL4_BETSP|nr:group 3 secretory phospholipase A2-like [Betta splendens]